MYISKLNNQVLYLFKNGKPSLKGFKFKKEKSSFDLP